MAKTAVATMQAAWDCRWSRPGYRVIGVPEQFQPEARWVCLRTGERRSIDSGECENCPHWQADGSRPTRH
jgi:hypothetical protein